MQPGKADPASLRRVGRSLRPWTISRFDAGCTVKVDEVVNTHFPGSLVDGGRLRADRDLAIVLAAAPSFRT